MNDISPLITIVIAVFNGSKTLQQCINSVLCQTYDNKELIVIDGGSTDGTVDLLKYNSKYINYWVSESDDGVYCAWNKGLVQSNGQWICFLGADDYFWSDQVLEELVENLIKIPSNIRLVYGRIMLINSKGESLYAFGESWKDVKKRFRHIMSIPHPGLMHRRSLFESNGNFDESFRIGGDYELLLRELKDADSYFIPNVITVGMRQGGLSSSPKNSLASLFDARRAQKLHGQIFPGLVWISALARVYARLLLWNFIGEEKAKKFIDMARKIMGLPLYWTKI